MYTEMKLMDLARRAYKLGIGETIDFSNKNADDAELYADWMGVKRIDEFDNDNLQYLIGYYGGEANVRFYAISEYDNRIGEFCYNNMTRYPYGYCSVPTEEDYIVCIARMIADFIIDYEGCVSETISVDDEI